MWCGAGDADWAYRGCGDGATEGSVYAAVEKNADEKGSIKEGSITV